MTNGRLGSDYLHRKARKRALEMMPEGAICWRCGLPMYHRQALDLDHIIPRVFGGKNGPTRLTHAHCNRADGARLKNKGIRHIHKTKSVKRW